MNAADGYIKLAYEAIKLLDTALSYSESVGSTIGGLAIALLFLSIPINIYLFVRARRYRDTLEQGRSEYAKKLRKQRESVKNEQKDLKQQLDGAEFTISQLREDKAYLQEVLKNVTKALNEADNKEESLRNFADFLRSFLR